VIPFAQQTMPRNAAPMYSNIIKKYSNWNVCFSCGFDVEDGHTSKTCPAPWRRANHQEGFDRNNAGINWSGVRCVYQSNAQESVAKYVMVWGRAGRS